MSKTMDYNILSIYNDMLRKSDKSNTYFPFIERHLSSMELGEGKYLITFLSKDEYLNPIGWQYILGPKT